MIGRYADPLDPPDGVSIREALWWNDLLDRRPRLELLCDADSELDRDLSLLRDAHEEDGVRLGVAALPAIAIPRMTAWERLVLAVMTERAQGNVSLVAVSEIAARLRAAPLTVDRHRVERAVFRLITRRFIARRAGGGFVLLRRAA